MADNDSNNDGNNTPIVTEEDLEILCILEDEYREQKIAPTAHEDLHLQTQPPPGDDCAAAPASTAQKQQRRRPPSSTLSHTVSQHTLGISPEASTHIDDDGPTTASVPSAGSSSFASMGTRTLSSPGWSQELNAPHKDDEGSIGGNTLESNRTGEDERSDSRLALAHPTREAAHGRMMLDDDDVSDAKEPPSVTVDSEAHAAPQEINVPKIFVMMQTHQRGVDETMTTKGHKHRCFWSKRNVFAVVGLTLVSVVAVIVLLVFLMKADDESHPSILPNATTTVSTFDKIKANGTLYCGVGGRLGFSALNKAGNREGFEVDLCRAIGAAVDKDVHVVYTVVTSDNQFNILQSGYVDVLAAGTKHTMQSDIYEPSANAGFTFSAPYLHNGLGFAGLPQFVACAEALQTTGNCSNITICVQDTDTLTNLFPNFQRIKLAPKQHDLYYQFKGGLCNVIAAAGFDLMQVAVKEVGYTGQYQIGLNQYSKEPLALVTRDDDVEWSDLVNWVLNGLLSAEIHNVTKSAVQAVESTTNPVVKSQITFYHSVATVGNYGEVYERNLGSLIPRAYVNMLNDGSIPLIASVPFGNLNVTGPGPTAGGTLEQIKRRGSLRCGVAENVFFSKFDASTWSGLDIDLCRAVSAALFGSSSNPVFVNVTAANRFQELANGNIDIISRIASVTYERDVNEATTRRGFSFSQPYFYTGLRFGGIPPYVECADEIDVTSWPCAGLKICVTNGTTTIDQLYKLFPSKFIFQVDRKDLLAPCLVNNHSQVIAGVGFDTANATIQELYTGPYQEGTKLFTRDNSAIVTNQDDTQWTSFVSLVVTALFYAEEKGITQATFHSMPAVSLFGPDYANMLKNVVQAVGSYGEMYERSANSKYPRSAINRLSAVPYGPQHSPPPGLFGYEQTASISQ